MEKLITTKDGLSLWSEAFGKPGARPILLIMGAMNQGIFWPDEFCRELAQAGNYVIRYDHRDTGQSSTVDFGTHPYDLNVLAEDAVAVLQGHGIKRAIVIGLSMGGYIAQIIAVSHPELVERLVLISTTADHRPYMAATMGLVNKGSTLPPPSEKLLEYIRTTAADPPQTATAVEQNMIQGWAITYGGERPFPEKQVVDALHLAARRARDQAAGFNHALAVAASADRLDAVKHIQAPTLIIHGRHDALLPMAHAEHLAQNIPGARIELLDMGHSFMWSWTNEVLSSIAKFVKN